jgi:hypothetical protein
MLKHVVNVVTPLPEIVTFFTENMYPFIRFDPISLILQDSIGAIKSTSIVYAYLSSRSYEGLNIEIRREQSIN